MMIFKSSRRSVGFRDQQFVLRLGLLGGRRVQGRLRRRPDGRRRRPSAPGADDGEGEGAGAVQQDREEGGAEETVSVQRSDVFSGVHQNKRVF